MVVFYLGRLVKHAPTPFVIKCFWCQRVGAAFGKHWCCGEWPDSLRNRNIAAFLEFYPIFLSLHLWENELKNERILFFTVDEALVHVINRVLSR